MKKRVLLRIPAEVHQKFKLVCIAKGKSMNETIIEFMKDYGNVHGQAVSDLVNDDTLKQILDKTIKPKDAQIPQDV